jgi:CDP-paratose 2-epimerase
MKILVTGAAGFIGSHAAEYFARKGHEVVALDNLSRAALLRRKIGLETDNWERLAAEPGVRIEEGDVRDSRLVGSLCRDVDAILHAAGQTAVTVSLDEPGEDFSNNALGTLTVLEAARLSGRAITILYCSTNKVYGENVNTVGVVEHATRYAFEEKYERGIPEEFPVDHCPHTPYGCSKLAGDLYVQDYARYRTLRTGIFRMSAIYGPRQCGVEDQGWVVWFAIATLAGKPLTIYGDGKQVRDILFIDDLLLAYELFLESDFRHGIFNTGGGPDFTLSPIELIALLEKLTGKRSPLSFKDWRTNDQKVYTSNTARLRNILGWRPQVPPAEGVSRLVQWVRDNLGRIEPGASPGLR